MTVTIRNQCKGFALSAWQAVHTVAPTGGRATRLVLTLATGAISILELRMPLLITETN